jgi:hypothetical protein
MLSHTHGWAQACSVQLPESLRFLMPVLRWVAWLIAGVALAVGLILAANPLWLRTAHGHRTVERTLTRLLNERVAGSVTVGRLSGNLVHGLRAEPLIVRNPRGELIGRTDWMAARWRLLALIRRHEIAELTVRRPTVALDRGTWRVPPEEQPRAQSKGVTIGRIFAEDGQVSWKRTTFGHVTGSAMLRTKTNLDVHALSALIAGTALRASGVVGWGVTQPGWVATRFMVERRGQLRGTGEIFYTPGRLEGEIVELTLEAPVATRLVGGSGPVRLRGGVAGATDNLSAVARASQAGRALELRAFIDSAARAASVDARLAGVPRPIRLRARLRYSAGALVVPMLKAVVGHSRLDGSGVVRPQTVHASARLQLLPSEAQLLALHPAVPVRAQIAFDGPPRRLAIDVRARVAQGGLVVHARADVPARRARARVATRQLRLEQLVAGAPPLVLSTMLTLESRLVSHAIVANVEVARGRLTTRGRTFDRLTGTAKLRLARSGEARIRRFSGRLLRDHEQLSIGLSGRLRWTPATIGLEQATVTVGQSRWSGDLRYERAAALDGHHIHARVHDMTLSPALVARLLHYRPPAPWLGRATLDGTPADLTLRLDAATEQGPATLVGRLRRDSSGFDLPLLDAQIGDSRLRGAARLEDRHLTVRLDELVLEPALLHQALPPLEPVWPLSLRGALDGPLDAVDATLLVDAGPSAIALGGRIDLHTRRFHLAGHLDTVDVSLIRAQPTRAHGSLELAVVGQLSNGGVVGTLAVRHARGFIMHQPFYRGLADARLDGRAFELTRARFEIPGAKLVGRGRGAYGKGFRIVYGLVITNALALRHVPDSLRVLIGINTLLPGRSIEGAIEKRPGEKVKVTRHVLPIGISQLEFLFRILTGGTPSLDRI